MFALFPNQAGLALVATLTIAWVAEKKLQPFCNRRVFPKRVKRVGGVGYERSGERRPDAYLAHSIGIFSGGKPQKVRLRATGVALRIFQERRWHATQKVVTSKDGSEGTVTMEVAITPELERFILGWGAEVQVLAPASLVKGIAKTVGEMAGRY